jgi:hypothetical protein
VAGPARSAAWSTVTSVPVAANLTGAAVGGRAVVVGVSGLDGGVSCVHPIGVSGGLIVAGLSRPPTAAPASPPKSRPASPPTTVAGRLAAPGDLGLNIDDGPVATGSGAAVMFSRPLSLSDDCETSENLDLARLDAGGRLTDDSRLASGLTLENSVVRGNRRGAVAAAWIQTTQADRPPAILRLVIAPTGRPPQPAIRIAERVSPGGFTAGIASAGLGIDGAGDTLVAYATDRHVFAETLDPLGNRGAVQTIGPCNGTCEVTVADAPNGRAVIAWSSQSGSSEPSSPLAIRAAIRQAPDQPFGSSRVVDPGQTLDTPQGKPRAAIASGGRAILEWTNAAGPPADDTHPVRAAIAPPGGSFGPIIALAPNGESGTVAIGPDGEGLVTWVDSPPAADGVGPVRAALTPAGDPSLLGPTTLPGIRAGDDPLAAFTPAGTPLVTWEAVSGNVHAIAISIHR